MIKKETNDEKGIINNRTDIGISKYSSWSDNDDIDIFCSADD